MDERDPQAGQAGRAPPFLPGADADAMRRTAEGAGLTVLDLSGWEGNRRPDEVKRGETDHHANALGHRLIAERLEAALRGRPELLGPP